MTRSELRKARRLARKQGEPLSGELALQHLQETSPEGPAVEFGESARGYDAQTSHEEPPPQ